MAAAVVIKNYKITSTQETNVGWLKKVGWLHLCKKQ